MSVRFDSVGIVASGRTLTTLSEASGIERTRLHRIETFKRQLRDRERKVLSRILRVSPDSL